MFKKKTYCVFELPTIRGNIVVMNDDGHLTYRFSNIYCLDKRSGVQQDKPSIMYIICDRHSVPLDLRI